MAGMVAARIVRIAFAAGLTAVLVFSLLLLVGQIAGAPPLREIHIDGARPIAWEVAAPIPAYGPLGVRGPLSPTASLGGMRCQAWQQGHTGQCPDAAALAHDYWPDLQERADTVYLSLLPSCGAWDGNFNIEYINSTLTMHCYWTAAWYHAPSGGMGSGPQAMIQLLLVNTTGIPSGQLRIFEEDRVERWLTDQVTTSLVGVVTIAG